MKIENLYNEFYFLGYKIYKCLSYNVVYFKNNEM